ncbi:hypothetical protein KW800_01375 [Candidatus Parcubacteria bacterium]|nr:hypothetical protein [Candidatus Parcubacteria bacterium]
MTKAVAHIFGSEAKVKVMRLFIYNRGSIFTTKTIIERVKESSKSVRKELGALVKAGLIKKRAKGFVLADDYRYLSALEHFMTDTSKVSERDIVKKLSKAGNMRLVLTSGFFRHDPEARVDLLVVGDKIKPKRLISAIASIEADLGRELRYAAFETVDFKYRLGVYDKLIRDILDYPHQKLIDKVGVPPLV